MTVYVANSNSGTVTPIRAATDKAGKAITVGDHPSVIAITPNGQTAYVANSGGDRVTPIRTATNTTRKWITVGSGPDAIAITPPACSRRSRLGAAPSRSRRSDPAANPLVWEDARRVVFQTMIVMYEVASSLQALLDSREDGDMAEPRSRRNGSATGMPMQDPQGADG